MSYTVKSGDIFGRVGSGLGSGLAEQLPQEVDRNRLSKGLQEIDNNKNLTPLQRFGKYLTLPGLTPQGLQGLTELSKQQAVRQAYSGDKGNPEIGQNPEPQNSNAPSQQQDFRNVGFLEKEGIGNRKTTMASVNNQGINPTNPANPAGAPREQWSPAQRDADISRVLEKNPYATLAEAREISANNEARYLAQPEAFQKQQDYFEGQRDKAYAELDRQLETKLQKEGGDVYKDITGENKVKLQRLIERDLIENPKESLSDIVNKRTNQAVEFAKTKKNLNVLANRDILDKIFKQGQTLDKLKEYSKIYKDMGAEQEFFDFLSMKEVPAQYNKKGELVSPARKGMNMSPQGAALIAYPLSKSVSSYTDKIKPSLGFVNSAKYAIDLEDKLTGSDSLLAIAKTFRDKDPTFNQNEFFNQIRQDQDRLRLNDRQRRELAEGEGDITPDWGDIWILPSKQIRGYL